MASYSTISQPTVHVDISAARRGVREAITVQWIGTGSINPGEASALSADLATASEVIDRLAPPLPIGTTAFQREDA